MSRAASAAALVRVEAAADGARKKVNVQMQMRRWRAITTKSENANCDAAESASDT